MLGPDGDAHLLTFPETLPLCEHDSVRGFDRETLSVHTADSSVDDIGFSDKIRHKATVWTVIDFHGRADLQDHAAAHDGDAVRHGHGLFLIVCDIDEGDAELSLQALELNLHLLAQLEVQRTQRLIQQQHARVVDQRPCYGDALLLPARQRIRLALFVTIHLHQMQHLCHSLLDFRLGDLSDRRPIGHVVKDSHVREQRIVLEDGIDIALVRFLVLDALPLYGDRAGAGVLEARDHAKRCRFSTPRGTKQRQEFTLQNLQIQILNHMVFPVPLVHMLQGYDRLFHSHHLLLFVRIRHHTEALRF